MWQRKHGADSRAITRYFAKRYGFSLLAPPERLQSAANTRVWSVATPRKYVAKVFLAESAEVVTTEADVMEYVRATGIRVPEIVPDGSGRRIGFLAVGHRLLARRKLPLYVMHFEEFRSVDSLS